MTDLGFVHVGVSCDVQLIKPRREAGIASGELAIVEGDVELSRREGGREGRGDEGGKRESGKRESGGGGEGRREGRKEGRGDEGGKRGKGKEGGKREGGREGRGKEGEWEEGEREEGMREGRGRVLVVVTDCLPACWCCLDGLGVVCVSCEGV
ncbi:hypothetical protein Pmani_037829 [Petrolisthes manimaculis]|uniref:Uncharacterized protein n=1 Tax=Petrolisthes manimaculis TaxID=1843537 RepID=A0AAE1TMX7_9EUCA|nr:hypothetical protein Pmani_037829 [Petrolisthes manimaculis]